MQVLWQYTKLVYLFTYVDYFNTQATEAVLYLWSDVDDDTPVQSQQPKGLKGRQAKGGNGVASSSSSSSSSSSAAKQAGR